MIRRATESYRKPAGCLTATWWYIDQRMELQEKLVLVETAGSVLWFAMDGFWMLNVGGAAKAMVMPTLAMNLLVFRYTRRTLSQVAVVAAMNSWLLMNICWMVGDLDRDPRALIAARVLFGLGIALLIIAVGRGASRPEVLARFRRLRM